MTEPILPFPLTPIQGRTFAAAIFASALFSLSACAPNQNSDSGMKLNDSSGIIGGVNSRGDEPYAKHVVALMNIKAKRLCTATILSEQILLTAAHCVEHSHPTDQRVIFGPATDAPGIVMRKVEDFLQSPIYPIRGKMITNSGDIAIVKFSGGLPPGYAPVRILADSTVLKDGTTVMLAGYGVNSSFLVRDSQTGRAMVAHDGSGALRAATSTILKTNFTVSELLIDSSKGTGVCHGDSGGPAFAAINGELVLIGVTNHGIGDPADTCMVSAAFASTAFYAQWIAQTVPTLLARPVPARPAEPAVEPVRVAGATRAAN